MMDTFSYATALDNPVREIIVTDPRVNDPPTYCVGAAGVLRYNRVSDSHRLSLATILPESLSLTEYPVKCEYCGEQARPSLDLRWLHQPEMGPLFCCTQWQQLCEILVKQKCLLEGRDDLRSSAPASRENNRAANTEELHIRDRAMEDYNKFVLDLPVGLGILPELITHEDYSIQHPVTETVAPMSKVFSFRLSCGAQKGCWTVYCGATTDKCLHTVGEGEQVLVPFCEHTPLHFGICHHQDRAEFLQKFYSSGMKFLTVFPDGSAQVFYPSGLLAVVVVVTEENGRVCLVYDDSRAPNPPMRALFQSDGRATCYHSNGNVWLSLNKLGGQCLDEVGARVRRWCWSSMDLTPTPLHPVFLSLNNSIGVRVLGKEQVFVSFLANGQQAKFSVGTSSVQGESKKDGSTSVPLLLKEELLALAARIRIYSAIQNLHQYLRAPFHPRVPKATPSRHLQVVAQRLLEVTPCVTMTEHDRDFIQRCLKDCL
ncbi:hypothetical protein Q5P01_022447 [Channa striata]|uniref:FAM194 C-terminal domain-containing protein n=1 Tax=Channa striata TaxID=64152 RepID=A0AA88J8W3_CHASR|nr:hypothetical protein Q5P01_022447 [Channa striata]